MRARTPLRTNAVQLLKEDHALVKQLFDDFEEAKDDATRQTIAQKAISELKTHEAIEEEIFYPAVRAEVGEEELMNEAEEEHHIARVLINELEKLQPGDPRFQAKFMVLAENVRHHIKEEESEMLPKAKKSHLDLDALGSQMVERKEVLRSAENPE